MSLIDKIQKLDIHPDYDVRGSGASIVGTFDEADIIRQQQVAENKRIADFNNEQMGKQGLGALIKSGAAATMITARDALLKQDAKSKKDALDTAILLALQNRLDELHEARSTAVDELNEIRESRAAVETLRQLFEDGKLDPDNKDHQALMEKADITRQDLMADPTGAFDRQAKFWDEREQNKVKEIKDIDQDIAETKQIIDASPEERKELLKMADEEVVHKVASTNQIDDAELNTELQSLGYSDADIEMRKTSATNNMFDNGDFGINLDDKATSIRSFASTLDLGEPPAILNLSEDFQSASNAVAPNENLPVLDLDQGFKLQ